MGDAKAGFHEDGDLVVGEGALCAIGYAEGSSGMVTFHHGDDDSAFHPGLLRAGANVASGVGLDIAGIDGLGAFDGESGHAFADGDLLDDLQNDIGDAERGFEMQDAVFTEQMNGAGFGMEMGYGKCERAIDGLRRGERSVQFFQESHALIVQHQTR